MYKFINFFSSLIEKIAKTSLHTEALRIKITKNKIKKICNQRYERELNDPNGYDVKASCCAIGCYQSLALEIETSTIKKYMKVLNSRVEDAQNNSTFPGEYGGGIGTYGSLQSTIINWYEDELRHYSLAELEKISDSIK